MKKFQVLTDSTSCVAKKYREEFGIDYVKMVLNLEGKEYLADLDWSNFTPDEFYGLMRQGKRFVTNLVTTCEFEAKFTEYLDKGLDVLYVGVSSALSGSVNNGKLVAEELLVKYPERKIICIDTLRANYGEGLIAMDAAKMANEGMDIEEVAKIIEETKLCYNEYGTVDSLEWLRKAGRVKATAAFFGNLFGVKPIICADAKGNNYAYKKVKGRKTSLDEVINAVCENIVNPDETTVFVEHAICLENANYCAEQIKAKINPKEIVVCPLGATTGAAIGPTTIIISFKGKKVEMASE